MRMFHVTSRDHALEILAHGFTEADVLYIGAEMEGVRFTVDLNGNSYHLGELPTAAIDEIITPEPELGPVWQYLGRGELVAEFGETVLAVSFPDGVDVDAWRVKESVRFWNRETNEIRETNHDQWTGEYLVPLDKLRGATVQLVEAELDADEEQRLAALLARRRAYWESKGVEPEEIERRLSTIDEASRRPESPG